MATIVYITLLTTAGEVVLIVDKLVDDDLIRANIYIYHRINHYC